MQVNGQAYRSIWRESEKVYIIDQTVLPHEFRIVELTGLADTADAIQTMQVRGAPLIGATAAYGMALAMRQNADDAGLAEAEKVLAATRPTAINLRWALARMTEHLAPLSPAQRPEAAILEAGRICDEDVAINEAIGRHGLQIIKTVAATKPQGSAINILTHCNAGWIATVDWGTALAPIFMAHDAGINVHVWVDETRPRNQGAALTAWELGAHGVPHHVIVDNAGGHLMQHGLVDLCIVGTDRTTSTGDVCNKIGTYLKALAAKDNKVPFYVALPTPTIDWTVQDGVNEVPIEQRSSEEVTHMSGLDEAGTVRRIRLTPTDSPARNDAFDVTPGWLVTALITEVGIVPATSAGLASIRRSAA